MMWWRQWSSSSEGCWFWIVMLLFSVCNCVEAAVEQPQSRRCCCTSWLAVCRR